MTDFDPLLDALRILKSSGDVGFEGLVRDCLEKISQRTLRLQKSGAQGGQDFRSDSDLTLPIVAIEAKRFGATTNLPLDELKSKLRETVEAFPPPDLWGLVLSREMKQPDWSELQRIGAEFGVTLLCLDWRDAPGSLPVVAAVCAAGRLVAEPRLGTHLAPVFDKIESHPDFHRIIDDIRSKLTAPELGFDLAQEAAKDWLSQAVASASKARQTLRSHADIMSADAHHIARADIEQKITHWWQAGPKTPLALLGDEGRGKTWVALSWCLDRLKGANAPLILASSAKDIQTENAGAIIADLLHRCSPTANRATLEARLKRWVSSGSSANILVVIDGLNEKWHINWSEVVKSFDVEPWKGRVSLVLTARSAYWRDDLLQLKGTTEEAITEVIVPEFTDAELDQYLATHKLQRLDLPRALLELIRIPRFARLAITLRDKLNAEEDLTIGRLVMEDWRSRLSQKGGELKVDDESLINFVAGLGKDVLQDQQFTISEREIHERLSGDSGRDLDHYRAAMNEIVEGLWLTRGATAHRYKVNAKLLPYAIGLDLANTVEGLTERAQIDDIIAQYEEQLRGADIGVAILRAAASTSFARQKATRVALQALLEAWIGSQNFRLIDFEEMWPLISRNADIFLDFAEQLWTKQPVGRGEGEILVKGLANASKWPIVESSLTARCAAWAGAFGIDPARWWNGDRLSANEDRQAQTKANFASWQSAEANHPRKVSQYFRQDEDDWLPDAAFAIISYLKRGPFIDALVTWAVTRGIMAAEYGIDQLEWVLRLNAEDQAAFQSELLSEIASLQNLSNPIATSAAQTLAEALAAPGIPVKLREPETSAIPPQGAWPFQSSDTSIQWGTPDAAKTLSDAYWLERLSPFASDRTSTLSSEDKDRATRIAGDVASGTGLAGFEPLEKQGATLTLSRWLPGALGSMIRRKLPDCLNGNDSSRRDPIALIEEINLVLDGEQRKLLLQTGLSKLQSLTTPTDDQQRSTERRYKQMVVAGAVGKSAAEQIQILKALLPHFSFSRPLALLMAPLDRDELQTIFDMLADETDEEAVHSWLCYLGEVGFKDLPQDPSVLVTLAQHQNKTIRAEAISMIWQSEDDALNKAFIETGWTYAKGQDRVEALTGSYIVSKFGNDLDFDTARQRILPQALPHLVGARGMNDAELRVAFDYVQELLDEQITPSGKERSAYPHVFEAKEAWRKLVVMDGEVTIRKTQQAAKAGRLIGMFNIFPLIEVAEAILEMNPAAGVEILLSAKQTHRQNGLNVGDFDRLMFLNFQHPDVARLRRSAFDDAKNDAQLADAVYWTLQNKHEDWLLELVEEDLKEPGAGRFARGLTIAGFMDHSPKVELLWKHIKSLSLDGWLANVRIAAQGAYEENLDARHWFELFLTATDKDLAFDYMNLVIDCLDARSLLWIRPMLDAHRNSMPHAFLEHLDIKMQERTNRRKRIEDERKKTLHFRATVSSISPWL